MSTSSELTANCYLSAVKELLKQRGVTYGDLAEALACSLPTIKRSLNKPSLPLDRLLEIAEVAHIDFADICKRAEQLRPQHYVFSDEQDELFVKRPEMLVYLQELMDGKTPSEIADECSLDLRSTQLYLKQLEQVGLIKRRSNHRAKLLIQPPVGFGPRSRYLKQEMGNFLSSIVTNVVNAEDSEGCFAILKPMLLSEQDYAAMIDGMKRLINQYSAISERQTVVSSRSPRKIAIACGPGDEEQSAQLPQISK